MQQWILTYLASFLEDIADATMGRNFGHADAILLGMAGASVMKNIVDRFQRLSPAEREALIRALKGEPSETIAALVDAYAEFLRSHIDDSFTQTFTKS